MLDGYLSDFETIDDYLFDIALPINQEIDITKNSYIGTDYIICFLIEEVQSILKSLQHDVIEIPNTDRVILSIVYKIKKIINYSLQNKSSSLLCFKQILSLISNYTKIVRDFSIKHKFQQEINYLNSTIFDNLHAETFELNLQEQRFKSLPKLILKNSEAINCLKNKGIVFVYSNKVIPCDFSSIIHKIIEFLKTNQCVETKQILIILSEAIKNPLNILDLAPIILQYKRNCEQIANVLQGVVSDFLKIFTIIWDLSLAKLISFQDFLSYSMHLTVSTQLGSNLYSVLNDLDLLQSYRPIINISCVQKEIYEQFLGEALKRNENKQQLIRNLINGDIDDVLNFDLFNLGWKILLLKVIEDSCDEYPTVFNQFVDKNELLIGGEELSGRVCSHVKMALEYCDETQFYIKASLKRIIIHSNSENCLSVLKEELTNIVDELGSDIFNYGFLSPLFDLCFSAPSSFTKPIEDVETNSAFAVSPSFENAPDLSTLLFALNGSRSTLYLSLLQLQKLISELNSKESKYEFIEDLSMKTLNCIDCPAFPLALNKLFMSYPVLDSDDEEIYKLGVEIDEISLAIYDRLKDTVSIVKPERIVPLIAHIEPKGPVECEALDPIPFEFSYGKPHSDVWKENSIIPDLDEISLDLDSEAGQLKEVFGDMASDLEDIIRSLL